MTRAAQVSIANPHLTLTRSDPPDAESCARPMRQPSCGSTPGPEPARTLLVQDLDVRIVNAITGEPLRELTIDPDTPCFTAAQFVVATRGVISTPHCDGAGLAER